MTKKIQVNLATYQKRPRVLAEAMERELIPGGGLHPVLAAVTRDPRLRLEIRDRRFNVYYSGGNLLGVDGRKSSWLMHFDQKYFKGGSIEPPSLPAHFSSVEDSLMWVKAFPALIAGMEDWWTRHKKGEKKDCQDMAAVNSAEAGLPLAGYLVVDLEYQWAQRRFDMVVAKRNPTQSDPPGWVEPDFVFVEVKSEYGACNGTSGLAEHARDYRAIIMAREGECSSSIKREYEDVIAQKMRLGLLHQALPFKHFSRTVPELLIVFVTLDPQALCLQKPLAKVKEVADSRCGAGCIRFMSLSSSDVTMAAEMAVPPGRLVRPR